MSTLTVQDRSTRTPQPGSWSAPRHASGDDVRLFGEAQLSGIANDASAPPRGFAGSLRAAASAHERERLVRTALDAMGFDWLGYGSLRERRGDWRPHSFLTTYANPLWTQRYFNERYDQVDPRHRLAPRSSLPLVWSTDDVVRSAQGEGATGLRQRRFLADFCDSGMRSGVFFHLGMPGRSQERVVVSLVSRRANCAWIDDGVLGRALAAGLCLHDFIAPQIPADDGTALRQGEPSALQQRILQCLLHGQSDKEIAYGLQLSSHAVDYHMRQLRRRFAARNRVQLLNAALLAH